MTNESTSGKIFQGWIFKMPRKQRVKSKTGYYHIMCRGNERKSIFCDDQDRMRFIENDYVLALTRYIHQNPVKAGMVQTVGDYQWSSYHSYLDTGVFGKLIETDTVLGLFSENREVAKKLFKQYMNGHADTQFLDLAEKDKLRFQAARELFRQMLREPGIDYNTYREEQLSDVLIREFSRRTNWSVREIASLTGINKDKINKIVRC